jgi:hypothetical protein
MADDLKNKGNQDRSKISLGEPWEISYWTKICGCTEEELKDAIKRVGNSSQVVKDLFQKK